MTHFTQRHWAIGLSLALLMALTRFDHFGSAVSLPDASLAVFFLAGFYLPALAFPALLLEAAAIDYLATAVGGVSDWCITPAYSFLAFAYGALWLAGRWYSRRHALAWRSLLPFAGAAVVATLAAFVISNTSFYLFAGYFDEMAAGEYAARVVRYLPGYLQSALLWLVTAAGVHVLLTLAAGRSVRAHG